MKLSEYHIAIKKRVLEYLQDQLVSPLLQEGKADIQYKKLLHHLGSYREDVWAVISPFKEEFDKKIYSIAGAVSQDPAGIRKAFDTFSRELKEKASSNKRSVDNQFGKGSANNLFECLRGRRSDLIESVAKMVAEREEIELNEESVPHGKNAISSAIFETSICAKQIADDFSGKTPCGSIMLQYAELIDPNKWIKRVTSDVFSFIISHSEENRSDELEESIYFRVQDIIGEMILTTPVWLLISLADELKHNEPQIISEIVFVSMLSPDNLVMWDKFFRRVGIGSITLRIGEVLKHINK